jgi:hypothetical protein
MGSVFLKTVSGGDGHIMAVAATPPQFTLSRSRQTSRARYHATDKSKLSPQRAAFPEPSAMRR